MTQFGRKQFGRRPPAFPANGRGGQRRAGGFGGQSNGLSSEAQSFLNSQRANAGTNQGSSLDFLSAATASVGDSSSEKFGEKPVAWIRIISYLIDSLIVGVPFVLLAWPMFTTEMDAQILTPGNKFAATVAGTEAGEIVVLKYMLMYSIIRCIYAIVLEASSLQATLGKMMCGLVVTDSNMRKPSLFGVIMRNTFGRFCFNVMPFSIGYFLLIFSPNKRGIHDIMSGTLVCRKGSSPVQSYAETFA